MAQPEGVANAKCFIVKETTYGTAPVPQAADALRVLSVQSNPNRPLRPNNEQGRGRSRGRSGLGRTSAQLTLSTYLYLPATAGAATELDKLLENHFGKKTVTAGQHIDYALGANQEESIACYYETDEGQELVDGFSAAQMTIAFGGTQDTEVTFQGPARQINRFTNLDLASVAASADQAPNTGGNLFDNFGVGNVVKFGSGAAVRVVSIASGGATMTLAAAQTAGSNVAVRSGLPTPSYPGVDEFNFGGDDLAGEVSFDDGTTAAAFLSGQLTSQNGTRLLNEEFGSSKPAGVGSPELRTINPNLTVYARTSELERIGKIGRRVSFPTKIVFGDKNGRNWTFSCPQLDLNQPPVTRQLGDYSQIQYQGEATVPVSQADTELSLRVA